MILMNYMNIIKNIHMNIYIKYYSVLLLSIWVGNNVDENEVIFVLYYHLVLRAIQDLCIFPLVTIIVWVV